MDAELGHVLCWQWSVAWEYTNNYMDVWITWTACIPLDGCAEEGEEAPPRISCEDIFQLKFQKKRKCVYKGYVCC